MFIFLYNYLSPTLTPQPLTQGHEIYNFWTGILSYHSYVPSWLAKCQGAEEENFKELMHLHDIPFEPTLSPKPLTLGPWKAYYNYASSLTFWCPGVEKKIFFKNCINFDDFSSTFQVQRGLGQLSFTSLYPYMLYAKFGWNRISGSR